MRQISSHANSEIFFWGCVPSYVETAEGIVLIDTPNLPSDAMRWKEHLEGRGNVLRYIINTEPHTDHVYGNSYFQDVEVVAQEGMRARYELGLAKMLSTERYEAMKTEDPDSVWLLNHPDYPPHPPTVTFTDQLVLEVGDHTFECLNLPGHTAEQTAIFVRQEGVVFTGDNVFSGCKTWMQEGDPWNWLESLDRIGQFDFEVLVAGHGEPRDRSYLATQAEIIRNWVGTVQQFVDAGMSEEEALAQPIDVQKSIDPYPIGQRYFPADKRVNFINVRNLYRRILERSSPGRSIA